MAAVMLFQCFKIHDLVIRRSQRCVKSANALEQRSGAKVKSVFASSFKIDLVESIKFLLFL